MVTFNKYLQKVNTQSVDYLKQSNLKKRLIFDYNKEIITYNDNQYAVIIQVEKTSNNESYYKISALNESNLCSGNVIYWDRLKNYYMIFFQRKTEKSYFIGRIYEAKYLITYLDDFNNKIKQYGVVKSINDAIKDEDIGSTESVAELIDGDMLLYLEKTDTINSLMKRNKYIKIANRNWKIVGWDDLTYDNIISFNLVETLNFDEDTDIPYPEIDYNLANITSNIDNINTVQLNSNIDLNINTIFKDNIIEEEYLIETTNCKNVDRNIIFNNTGTAKIKIIGQKTKVEKEYSIEVQEEIVSNLLLKVSGRALVKQSVPYTYIIRLINNGQEMTEEEFNNKYDITFEKDEKVKTKKVTSSEFFLIINDIGKYVIKIKAMNKENLASIEKDITIECEDLLS